MQLKNKCLIRSDIFVVAYNIKFSLVSLHLEFF
jgi:hypothetical protein